MSADRRIEAVIFNMDGVLTDSEPLLNAPGAVDRVQACQNAGLRVAIASSADRVKIDAHLRKIGLPPETWDAIVTAEDVALKKPAPDIYLASARKLGLLPEQCVAIEDAVNGVQAAKSAGMRCVAVAQTVPPEQLQGADLVREKIAEISLDDLVGTPAGPSRAIGIPPLPIPAAASVTEPSPYQSGPWGFWATIGLGAVVAMADVGMQNGVLIVWIAAQSWLGQEPLGQSTGGDGTFVSLAVCASMPVAVGLVWLFARMRRGISVKEYLALNPVAWRTTVRWLAALVGLVILSDGLTRLLNRPIVPEVLIQTYQTTGFPPLLWLAVVVAAPLGEETFFRGFLFKGLLHTRLGGAGAIVLTALVWAVIHRQYDWYGVATVFAAGLLLGFARLRTNSIYSCLLMHALMNLIATIEVVVVIRMAGNSN